MELIKDIVWISLFSGCEIYTVVTHTHKGILEEVSLKIQLVVKTLQPI
jgi:hypothetical protein